MSNKKIYYISDIAKASERYDEAVINKVDSIAKAAIFGIAAGLTIWMPIMLKTNPNMDVFDKAKTLFCGVCIPAVTLPFSIKNLKNAIIYNKEAKKESKFIEENRRDITNEEILEYQEYLDDMKKNNMCLELKNK